MRNPLNEAQKQAAEAPKGPILIVAGAGTGKTRTLTSRVLYLIEQGIPPERICAITFTNKAAKEMKDRIITMTMTDDDDAESHSDGHGHRHSHSRISSPTPYVGTFHSLGARILRKECRALGRDPNFAIFDDHDSFDLLKKVMKAILPKQDAKTAAQKKGVPAFFAQKISEMKNIPRRDGTDGGATTRRRNPDEAHVPAVFAAYEEALARNNAFDFDDLIAKPVQLFAEHPATLRKYQAMFDAILVDEWQDINPKQHEFIAALAGGHRNLSVVGDDEQTIYSWRYADVRTFLDFEKNWPGAKIHFLEENYRSTANIINAAAAVAENNQFRAPKKLWTANPDGEPITLFEAWGENEEAAWVASQIRAMTMTMTDDDDAEGDGHGPQQSIAVLYRTNAQSRAIEQALIRHDIPYRIFGGLKFYERREVKDAVAALRWAANPKDEVSRERLEKNLTKKKFASFRNALIEKNDLDPSAVLTLFLEKFGYFEYLEGNFINATEREENISELATFVAGFKDLTELLEKLSLLQSTDEEANRPSAGTTMTMTNDDDGKSHGHGHRDSHGHGRGRSPVVHLSTIHMAKGLEFDVVFVAGAAEGLLPHARSIDKEDALEEERRLMYVAMTRARKKLLISFSGLPSRFLSEIPSEYLAQAESESTDGHRSDVGRGNDPDDYDEF